jgi:hypothetical protein
MEDIEVEEDESELLSHDFSEISQSQEEEKTGKRAPSGVFQNEAEIGLQEILARFWFGDTTLESIQITFSLGSPKHELHNFMTILNPSNALISKKIRNMYGFLKVI